jgi:hypothetical protein
MSLPFRRKIQTMLRQKRARMAGLIPTKRRSRKIASGRRLTSARKGRLTAMLLPRM